MPVSLAIFHFGVSNAKEGEEKETLYIFFVIFIERDERKGSAVTA